MKYRQLLISSTKQLKRSNYLSPDTTSWAVIVYTCITTKIDTAIEVLIQKINVIEMTVTELRETVNKIEKTTDELHQTVEQIKAKNIKQNDELIVTKKENIPLESRILRNFTK